MGEIRYKTNNDITINEIVFDKLISLDIRNIHINWQNDFDYIKKLEGLKHYGAYVNDKLIGAISVNKKGSIFFIWVDDKYRHKGIGSSLLIKVINELKLEVLNISFPSNTSLEGFVKKMNFQKLKLFQYEMYLTLD
ncbi:MAG: GNAT family N-acetyltransferase [Tissierellia bacterium]|nr:GNAT family N-acetyltransferase [Tissierellia bacterium]